MTTDDENLHDGDADLSATPDVDLVLRSRSGDREAFAELWRRHYRSGVVAARSITSSFDADDLVQEAYAKIFQSIRRGKGPTGSFRAYLFTAIRNIAASWGRSSNEVASDELENVEDPGSTDQATDEALDRSLTHTAFRSLPTRWQEVLWYTEIEQMKPGEVAPLLGMKAAGVSQLAFRAREGLREAWIQAHIASVEDGSDHAWTIERLGAYTRENLGPRDRKKVEDHLGDCARCAIVASEAKEVSGRLALVLLPLTIGTAGAAAYLASLQRGEAAVVALAAMPSSVHEGAAVVAGGMGTAAAADGAAQGGGTASGTPAWTIGGLLAAGVAAVTVAGVVLAATLTGGWSGSANDAAGAFDDANQPDASIEASDELLTTEDENGDPIEPPIGSTPTPTPTPSASSTSEPRPESPAPRPSASPRPSADPLPTAEPEPLPEPEPSALPTGEPEPSVEPEPTAEPSPEPTLEPSPEPTLEPSPEPTLEPSPEPTLEPSPEPSPEETPGEPFAQIAVEQASVVDADERIIELELTGEADETVSVSAGATTGAAAAAFASLSFFSAADTSDALAEGDFTAHGTLDLEFSLTPVHVTEDTRLVIAYRDGEGDVAAFTASLSELGVRAPLLEALESEPTPSPSPTSSATPKPSATPTPTASPTPMPTKTPTPTPSSTATPPPTPTPYRPLRLVDESVQGNKQEGTVSFTVTGETDARVDVLLNGALVADDIVLSGPQRVIDLPLDFATASNNPSVTVSYVDGDALAEPLSFRVGDKVPLEELVINDALEFRTASLDMERPVQGAVEIPVTGEPSVDAVASIGSLIVDVPLDDAGSGTLALVLTRDQLESAQPITLSYPQRNADPGTTYTKDADELGLSDLLVYDIEASESRLTQPGGLSVLTPLQGHADETALVTVTTQDRPDEYLEIRFGENGEHLFEYTGELDRRFDFTVEYTSIPPQVYGTGTTFGWTVTRR
ncbi:sigma-70 family RNA polymerase sigma factor [Microbacterium betulae]|uniref:Sigma-70 family RNA polymerase sigma factor n=1 Tax=Microbacterium betulae TaxID=2981139 RepID=A0AA97FIN1_9MICO|nr:sigma-70 family RNA polymerase sigma factor [Microbacterium sp. AB]WOF23740.1 sigma-70 family RNA polymerase sigma factor [Microbacterium sp. AB]